MTKHNAENERVKRKYFAYLKEAKRQSEATVDAAASALYRFEAYTKLRDFRAFHIEQATAFKRYLGRVNTKWTFMILWVGGDHRGAIAPH
jgi:integrase/recombinase XerD